MFTHIHTYMQICNIRVRVRFRTHTICRYACRCTLTGTHMLTKFAWIV